MSFVTLVTAPVPFKHQLAAAAAFKCRLVADVNTGNTFVDTASFPVAACQLANVVYNGPAVLFTACPTA